MRQEQEMTPTRAGTENREIRYEFTFSRYNETGIMVCINPDHYGKSLRSFLTMLTVLEGRIPFGYTLHSEPDIIVFGGRFKRGVYGLEFVLVPLTVSRDDAVELLRALGFIESHEFLIG